MTGICPRPVISNQRDAREARDATPRLSVIALVRNLYIRSQPQKQGTLLRHTPRQDAGHHQCAHWVRDDRDAARSCHFEPTPPYRPFGALPPKGEASGPPRASAPTCMKWSRSMNVGEGLGPPGGVWITALNKKPGGIDWIPPGQFFKTPRCPRCGGGAPRPGCCLRR